MDGFHVGLHDVEWLGAHGIGGEHGAGAVKRNTLNLPAAQFGELVFGEISDFVVGERGFEGALGGFENLGVADEVVWVGDFVNKRGDDLLLVLAAVAVAGGIGVAFAGEGEGAFGIDFLFALLEFAFTGFEGLVGVEDLVVSFWGASFLGSSFLTSSFFSSTTGSSGTSIFSSFSSGISIFSSILGSSFISSFLLSLL